MKHVILVVLIGMMGTVIPLCAQQRPESAFNRRKVAANQQARMQQARMDQAALNQQRLEQSRVSQERLQHERMKQHRVKQARLKHERQKQARIKAAREQAANEGLDKRTERSRYEAAKKKRERLAASGTGK
ncbi:MAG TPA: hypothetical protein PKC24_03895 [Cyclobacteriaceae bacterium]|nr:hypothetical protein [Cyclobacteriaceae bacterium]